MTLEQVRNLYSAQPFQPFVIHMADGRSIPVSSREFIMTVPSGRTLVVAETEDRVHFIDLLLVTDLEVTSQSNGKRKRRA